MMKSNSKSNMHRLAVLLVVPALACFLWAFAEPEYHYIMTNTGDNKPAISELPDNVLYFIDDEQASREEAAQLEADKISDIRILKGEMTRCFTDAARNGVVLIKTTDYAKKRSDLNTRIDENYPKHNMISFGQFGIGNKDTQYTFFRTPEENPVIIINGEIKGKMGEFLYSDDSEVMSKSIFLYPEVARTVVGEKAKNGAIFIITENPQELIKSKNSAVPSDYEDLPDSLDIIINQEEVFNYGDKANIIKVHKDILYVIDGKKVSNKEAIMSFDFGKADKIEVLDSATASSRYGNLGKHGALLITLRPNLNGRYKLNVIKDALIVIDGKESDYNTASNLYEDEVEVMAVLRDEAATNEYGDRGTNGVIRITTKKAANR